MEEFPESSKESSHSAHANGMKTYLPVGMPFTTCLIFVHYCDSKSDICVPSNPHNMYQEWNVYSFNFLLDFHI